MDEAKALLASRGWNAARPLVAVAPGAAYGTAKRWPPEHFGAMLTRVIQDTRAQGVLVGTADDIATM
jgi:heptosyltransferase-2